MNKRQWRECYKDIRNEIDQVRRECAEELRRDNVRLATELARVQGLCEALKYSATIVNLRERENEALKESEGLLAWQRRVREGWNEYAVCTGYNTRLRQAIESEPDRQAYLAQIEKWGQAYEQEKPEEET